MQQDKSQEERYAGQIWGWNQEDGPVGGTEKGFLRLMQASARSQSVLTQHLTRLLMGFIMQHRQTPRHLRMLRISSFDRSAHETHEMQHVVATV